MVDPRAYWIYITPVEDAKWIIKDVAYLDETQSGGKVNIYVTVIDRSGAPLSGKTVMLTWGGRSAEDEKAYAFTEGGNCNFPMSGDSSFSPDRGEHGTYEISVVNDGISEIVGGMGLPLRRHVCYLITIQEYGVTPPPPPGEYVTHAELPDLVRRIVAEQMAK